MSKFKYIAGIVAIAIFPLSFSAQAQQATSANYDDWVVRCSIVTEAGAKGKGSKACEVAHNIFAKAQNGQNVPVALVAIGKNNETKEGLKIVVQVPAGALLTAPPKLTNSAGKELVTLRYVACSGNICGAQGDLTEAQMNSLIQSTEPYSLTFKNPTEEEVKLVVSNKGLTEAHKAMAEIARANIPSAADKPSDK